MDRRRCRKNWNAGGSGGAVQGRRTSRSPSAAASPCHSGARSPKRRRLQKRFNRLRAEPCSRMIRASPASRLSHRFARSLVGGEITCATAYGRPDGYRAGRTIPTRGNLGVDPLGMPPHTELSLASHHTSSRCGRIPWQEARRSSQPPHPPGRRTVNEAEAPYPGSLPVQPRALSKEPGRVLEIPAFLVIPNTEDRMTESRLTITAPLSGDRARRLNTWGKCGEAADRVVAVTKGAANLSTGNLADARKFLCDR